MGTDVPLTHNREQRAKTGPAGRAADQVRAGDQPETREGTGPHDPPVGAGARGRGDSVVERRQFIAVERPVLVSAKAGQGRIATLPSQIAGSSGVRALHRIWASHQEHRCHSRDIDRPRVYWAARGTL